MPGQTVTSFTRAPHPDQVAPSRGSHRGQRGVVLVVHGQHEYGDAGCDPADLPGRGDPVEHRHLQVWLGFVAVSLVILRMPDQEWEPR
jgi:hypothetical protein